MRSARRLYLAQLGVAFLGAGLVLSTAFLVLAEVSLALPSAATIGTACRGWLALGGPSSFVGVGITALAASVVVLGLRSAWRQVRLGRRYLDALPLGRVVEREGVRFRLVDLPEPLAFCAGNLRPSIFVTRGALEDLRPAELRAVLAHEQHHQARRDPLRRLLAGALAEALFFLPVLRRMSERYVSVGELAADEAAVRAVDDRRPLAAALVKFTEQAVPSTVAGVEPERVDHLLGDPKAGRWWLPGSLLVLSALALAGLSAIWLLLWYGAIDPNMQLPFLLAMSCMAAMATLPLAAGIGALRLSRRAPWARRG